MDSMLLPDGTCGLYGIARQYDPTVRKSQTTYNMHSHMENTIGLYLVL